MLIDNILPYIDNIDSNIWRWKYYICKDVDIVFKRYLPILKSLYEKYSGKFNVPGTKKTMSVNEWENLCNEAGIWNERFN